MNNADIEEELSEEARRFFNPEFLMQVAMAKVEHPNMFVSGWEEDDQGIEPQPDIENDVNARMLWAAENGRLEIVKDLLRENPSLVNARDNDLYTPLHRASYNDHADIVQFLLENGADVAAKTADGWQALHSAARWGSLNAARCLLYVGNADVNALTNGRLTPLHLAVSADGSVEVANLLLSHPNIDITIASNANELPFDIARQHSEEMMNLFVNRKA